MLLDSEKHGEEPRRSERAWRIYSPDLHPRDVAAEFRSATLGDSFSEEPGEGNPIPPRVLGIAVLLSSLPPSWSGSPGG